MCEGPRSYCSVAGKHVRAHGAAHVSSQKLVLVQLSCASRIPMICNRMDLHRSGVTYVTCPTCGNLPTCLRRGAAAFKCSSLRLGREAPCGRGLALGLVRVSLCTNTRLLFVKRIGSAKEGHVIAPAISKFWQTNRPCDIFNGWYRFERFL